jgi:hypothetical protein
MVTSVISRIVSWSLRGLATMPRRDSGTGSQGQP